MWDLEIENIGGIHSGDTTLHEGTNVVQASNFQGKSSLISAVRTVMGTTGLFDSPHPLTEGAETGRVRLRTDDKEYEVTLNRERPTSIIQSGTPYLTDKQDQVVARLFAFLGEDNPVRSAVRSQNSEQLTKLLQKPLDIEDIDRKIRQLSTEKDRLTKRIEEAERAAKELPAVQEEVTQLERELSELHNRRNELKAKVDEDSEQKMLREEVTDKQAQLERVKREIERLERQIERKQQRLKETEAELEALEIPDQPEPDVDIGEKEDRIDELELKLSLVSDLYRSNKAIVDENETDLVSEVERSIAGDNVTCWVCGESTSREAIQDRLRLLSELQQSLNEEKSTLESEIEEIRERKRKLELARRNSDELEEKIEQLSFDIEEDKQTLQETKERGDALAEEVAELKEQFKGVEDELDTELTEVQKKLGSKENELEHARSKLESLEMKANPLDDLTERRDEIADTVTELRNRRVNKQQELQAQFNDAMDDVLETFAPGFESARLDRKTNEDGSIRRFEIVVARDNRETTLDRLSEGEVELISFVTALAGYRTFNVSERVPCILVDGIGQLASEHMRNLTYYLEDATDILITTAYPEAGEFDGTTITPLAWDVVSN